MSLELSIFKRLLKEALLTHADFLEKVNTIYGKREKLEKDKILAKILELIKTTEVHKLKGSANKSNRKKAVNLIDDAVKAMTASGEISTSLQSLRKLYDSIIKYLAPDESGETKSDVSFDQCIRYSDIFLKAIYPNLAPDQKAIVDRGDFPYSEVFSLVSDYQKLSGDVAVDVDVIYEDEIIKIVYPLDSYSFSEYVKSNLPPIKWKNPWCTMDGSQWASYHTDFFIAVAYVKEQYKKDHKLSLISLKLSHEGDILYQETCDYYNKHMDTGLKKYLSDKCIKDCADYFKSYISDSESKVHRLIDELDSLVSIGSYEEFVNRLAFIECYEFLIDNNIPVKQQLKKTLSSLPKSFQANAFIEFSSITNCIDFIQLAGVSHIIKNHIKEVLIEDAKGNKDIFNLYLKKASRRNLNPRYANSFIRLLTCLARDSKSSQIFSSIDTNEVKLIISNSLNSNNPDFFRDMFYNFFLYSILRNISLSKEEEDEIIKNIFLSKSHISFYKENFDNIKAGGPGAGGSRFIHENLKIFIENHEEISRRANTDLLNIEEITKDVSLSKIKSGIHKVTPFKAKNLQDSSNAYVECENIFASVNREYNTSVTIEELLLSYNTHINVNMLILFFDNNNDEFLRKNLREKFVDVLIRDVLMNRRCLFGIEKSNYGIVLLDKIIDIILRTNRSDIWEKLFEATANELEKIPGSSIGHGIYTAVFGTNIQFSKMSAEFAIKYPSMLSLYKIPGFKRKLQNRIITSKHEDIFKIIFIYSTEYKDVLTDSLFEEQIKFIKENFNFPTFINIMTEFFVKEENGMFQLLSDQQKAKISEITKQYLDIDVFEKSSLESLSKTSSEEPEELVRDYVKTQL